jgi:hypothetical protein
VEIGRHTAIALLMHGGLPNLVLQKQVEIIILIPAS